MRSTVTIAEAKASLADWINLLEPGEELVITHNGKPVARLVGEAKPEQPPRQLGTMRGSVLYMAPDFDAPLECFKEYME